MILGSVVTFGDKNMLVQFYSVHFSSILMLASIGLYRPLLSRWAHIFELGSEFVTLILFNLFSG